jgi:sugar phosphate isomerase/epimerase
MDNVLSCNLGSYGKYREHALEHLASIGVKHVEVRVPNRDGVAELQDQLGEHGLSATTVMAPCPLDREDLPEQLGIACETAAALGAKIVFVSAKAGEVPLDTVYARLRAAGDAAAAHGVTLAMETHPDLCDNGAKMVATMAAVDHPNVGVNFDTANIYYYNEGIDGLAELRTAIETIVAVHLKDTSGGFKTWYFPTLGEGVVDYPGAFAALNARGFHGPFTMELEGIQGESLTQAETFGRVADSVGYLRREGLVP